jgi:hypothetical protein
MGFDHDRPKGAKFKDSTSVPRPVRWEDEEDGRAWLSALREGVEEGASPVLRERDARQAGPATAVIPHPPGALELALERPALPPLDALAGFAIAGLSHPLKKAENIRPVR